MTDKETSISNQEALEQLAHIKSITRVEKQKYGKEAGPYFIIWGLIWMIGFTVQATEWQNVIFWTWLVLIIIGWVFTIMTWFNQGRQSPMPTFLQTQLRFVWGSFAIIVAIFAFLIGTGLLSFTGASASLYMVFLVVILYLLLSVVLGKEILLMGIWLGVLSAATFIWFQPYMPFIYAVIGGGSLVVTGLLFIRKVHQNE